MRSEAKVAPRGGFTLVELLVVVGIIAVLIALLMPVLSKVRKHAWEVKCAANQRSIGQALTMYTQQYGHYPGCWIFDGSGNYAVWPVRLRPFLGGEQGVFLCPARDERFEWPKVPPDPSRAGRAREYHARFGYEVGEPLLNFNGRRFSYGYNGWGVESSSRPRGLGWQINVPVESGEVPRNVDIREPRAARVRSPSEMIAVTDSDGDGDYDFVTNPQFVANAQGSGREMPGNVHRGGANVLFCDGHVQWFVQKDLLVTYEVALPAEEPIRRMWNNDPMP